MTTEEATADGHAPPSEELFSEDGSAEGMEEEQIAATPVKNARARPLSEQMLGKSRPQEDDEGEFLLVFYFDVDGADECGELP